MTPKQWLGGHPTVVEATAGLIGLALVSWLGWSYLNDTGASVLLTIGLAAMLVWELQRSARRRAANGP